MSTTDAIIMAALVASMTLLGAVGGLLFKQVSRVQTRQRKLYTFLIGCVVYGLAAILNIAALHRLPYTVVFPLTAVTYVWTFVLSYLILKERLNRYKFAGLAFILLGTFLIAL